MALVRKVDKNGDVHFYDKETGKEIVNERGSYFNMMNILNITGIIYMVFSVIAFALLVEKELLTIGLGVLFQGFMVMILFFGIAKILEKLNELSLSK